MKSWITSGFAPAVLLLVPVVALVLAGCQAEPDHQRFTSSVSAPGAPDADFNAELETAIASGNPELASGRRFSREISGPTVIDRPGHYRVVSDFAVTGAGDAIVIRADHVSLNLGGHVITGPGNKIGRGIVLDGAEHVLVSNGTLRTFGLAVALLSTSHSSIRQVTALGGDEFADPPNGVPPQIGIMLINSFRNRLTDNDLRLVNLGIFVRGGGSYENRISRNRVVGGAMGLLAICYNPAPNEGDTGPMRDDIRRNVLSRFSGGIQTSAGSAHNRFVSNVIYYFDFAWQDNNGSNKFEDNETMQVSR